MVSLEELIARIREFFKGLPPSKVKSLSRGDLAKALGVDPCSLPPEYKRNLSKFYKEFGLSSAWISSRLAMCVKDITMAIKGILSTKKVKGT